MADAWLYDTCFDGSSITRCPYFQRTRIVAEPAAPVRTDKYTESSGENVLVKPLTVRSEFTDRPSWIVVT